MNTVLNCDPFVQKRPILRFDMSTYVRCSDNKRPSVGGIDPPGVCHTDDMMAIVAEVLGSLVS